MPLGPIIIYDKSAIQGLKVDEAVWLMMFYMANLTPPFFVEVMADLAKEPPKRRTAEDVVGNLADKVGALGTKPNIHHSQLCLGDLLGHQVKMNRVPVVGQGRPVKMPEGRRGVVFEPAAEMIAFDRWRQRDFLALEREVAGGWRVALQQLDLEAVYSKLRGLTGGQLKLRTLAEVKAAAERAAAGDGRRYQALKSALLLLGIPSQYHTQVIARWKAAGGPPLKDFAPYAHYVFTVELFFYLGLLSNQLARTRPSHRVDIAYLYYLPFCMVFTSQDKLHAAVAPLFLGNDQEFVLGQDLKADLAALDAHYSGLPDQVKARGAFKFAAHPPLEGSFLTSQLWDRFNPRWRKRASDSVPLTPELERMLLAKAKELTEGPTDHAAAAHPPALEQIEEASFAYKTARKVGKWRLF